MAALLFAVMENMAGGSVPCDLVMPGSLESHRD